MLEVRHLTKHYGKKIAVEDISFTVNQGEILGFLGPNGAGKTTTMNIITGYLAATSGEVLVDGIEVLADPIKVKSKIGYLPEKPPLYMDMTVREYLNFVFELKKIKLPRKKHIEEVCALVKINDVCDRVLHNLSKGYCQRVGIAQALLGNPELLILDEPTVGLDPKQIIEIRDLIQELGKKQTVILSSHILSEVQAVCDRIIVISKGKLVADDTTQSLSAGLSAGHKLAVCVDGSTQAVQQLLSELPGVKGVEQKGSLGENEYEYVLETEAGTDIRRPLFFALAKSGFPLLSSRSADMSLEDIFLSLTADISGIQQEVVAEPKSVNIEDKGGAQNDSNL